MLTSPCHLDPLPRTQSLSLFCQVLIAIFPGRAEALIYNFNLKSVLESVMKGSHGFGALKKKRTKTTIPKKYWNNFKMLHWVLTALCCRHLWANTWELIHMPTSGQPGLILEVSSAFKEHTETHVECKLQCNTVKMIREVHRLCYGNLEGDCKRDIWAEPGSGHIVSLSPKCFSEMWE